jgi:hypothetical protein
LYVATIKSFDNFSTIFNIEKVFGLNGNWHDRIETKYKFTTVTPKILTLPLNFLRIILDRETCSYELDPTCHDKIRKSCVWYPI